MIDVATGTEASWEELLSAASKRLIEWRRAASAGPFTLAVVPRNGLEGIIDLLAARQHDGLAAIVPAEYLRPGPKALTSTYRSAGTTLVVEAGLAAPVDRELLFTQLASPLPGKRLVAASGGSSGTHRVGEVPVGRLNPLPAAYRMTGLKPGSRMFVGGPWSHSAFLWAFYCAFESGSTAVVASQFRPQQVGQALDYQGVTWALLTPPEFQALASVIRRGAWAPTGLRSVVTTGGRTHPASREIWYGALAFAQVFDMYATTEGIGVLLANGDDQRERPGTSGRPVWAKAQVRDRNGLVLDQPGKTGELFLRSLGRDASQVTRYRSAGDLAQIDDDGYIFLMGRSDDEAVVEGQNVNLQEVARLVERATAVDEAVVLELQWSNQQSAYLGVVVVVDDAGLDDIRRSATPVIAAELGPLAVPRRWIATAALPVTANGKTDRRCLRRLFEDKATTAQARGESHAVADGNEPKP